MAANPLCVLVDADPETLAFMRRFLSIIRPDFEVVEFLDAWEALSFLSQHKVEVVITDYRMPALDGLGLTSAIRSLDRDVPIVMVSGDEIEAKALAGGVSAFLPKGMVGSKLGVALQRLRLHV